jgi:hypothetical protein
MADVSYLHYGARYPNGHVSDFSEDLSEATAETQRLISKGVNAELVSRKVGTWRRAKSQPSAVSNTPTTGSDTDSDRGRPGQDTEAGQ